MTGNLDFADGLVLQNNSLYYVVEMIEDPSIQAISLPSGSPRTVSEADPWVRRLAFDECLVYYATEAAIARTAR
jgi:hypothetical protein